MSISPNTVVRLLSDVPFNTTYEHSRLFTSAVDQSSYFLEKSQYTFLDFTYQREEQVIRVPRAYDDLYLCNYVMYKNTSFGNKWFYGFITHKEYVNPDFTKIYFELDVFQTWMFEMKWKQSFVVREHCKRWNVDGSPVLNTVDEGLDYGTEYETASLTKWLPFDDVFFMVVVSKNAMHGGSSEKGKIKPMVNGSPQPLSYYIHPFKLNGSSPPCTVDGMNIGISSLSDMLKGMYTIEGAVNNIVSIYVTEHIGYNPGYSNGTMSFNGSKISHALIQDEELTVNTLYVESLPQYENYIKSFGDKYLGYASVNESKLLMYPYTVTILDDFKGNRTELKNEYIDGQTLAVTVRGSLGTNNKVVYSVPNYKTRPLGDTNDKNILSLESALVNSNPNDIPIITDLLAAYLQGNRNQLQNQKSAIIYGGVADIVGNAFGGIGSAMGQNPVGAVSAASGMVQAPINAYFQIQDMMTKQQDIANTPPNIANMGGNTAFDYGNGLKGLYIIKKQITPEYQKKLADFFKMYGYRVNELKVPNLKTRNHFNYIQTAGANITGNIPNNDMEKIKSIFNTGVTLWHVNDVLNYSLTNGEI